ncbi:MAG: hypothetical protein EOQ55_03310 [Mesorhizobium sp.]|nr:MAG: hypothetical protein EOQ55_03310 [Mesorhizobium sp.]
MNGLLRTGLSTGVTGTVASVVTAAFLVLLAKAEGKSALQPYGSRSSTWMRRRKPKFSRRKGKPLGRSAHEQPPCVAFR